MIKQLFLAVFIMAIISNSHCSNLGRDLAANCANCHGTDGRSLGGPPSLAGVSKKEIVQKMKEFKEGKKPATIMHQLSKGYSDQQIELIADFFAAQKAN